MWDVFLEHVNELCVSWVGLCYGVGLGLNNWMMPVTEVGKTGKGTS